MTRFLQLGLFVCLTSIKALVKYFLCTITSNQYGGMSEMMRLSLRSIAAIMIFLFLLSSLLFYTLLKRYYEDEAFKRIEYATHFDKAIQLYVNTVQKPKVYSLINNGWLQKDFFDPALLSATYIANSVNDYFIAQNLNKTTAAVRIKFASDNPINIRNKTNAFEYTILQKLRNRGILDYRDRIIVNGKEHLFYAIPVERNTQDCLQCHGVRTHAPVMMQKIYKDTDSFSEEVGDLHAMIAIYTPIDADNEEMLLFFWSIEGLMLFIFALIYGMVYHYSQTITKKDALIARQSRFAAMGEMVGMIAHQWRQPLTGMSMTVNNMKLDIELSMVNEKKWESQLDVIEKQIAYLSHTIDDFRNFFKPNQVFVPVNVRELIEGSLGVIASTLKSHGIDITIVCDENIILNSARNDLMQVLLNLLKNAKDAYVETGISPAPLSIEVTRDDTWVKIMVKDSAGGISISIIHEIFNPYFSTKDEKNGTGLGLYMSKMIVEEHLNGKLEVSSSNGSTQFSILLPIGE